ncbi:MAG: TlpA disulfide reductase family protein [Candidatus Acidiferrales bacterium]
MLIGLLAAILLAAVAGFFTLKILEAKISRRFTAPQFHQALLYGAEPQADYDFQYSTLDGQVRRLSQLKGKVVFVNFWGTWCIQCIAEMPTIQTLYNSFRNDPAIAFVIASRLDPPGRVRWYAKHGHYDLPFYTVRDPDIPSIMKFNQYPATFIFAKDGTLAERQIGGADWSSPSVAEFIKEIENR